MDEPKGKMNGSIRKRGKGKEAVGRIRDHVQSGTYQVDSHLVAEAMLARVGLWPLSNGSDDRTRGPAAPHHQV